MNLSTSVTVDVGGQDGTPYRIRIDKEKEQTYIVINADLFLDADQEPVGPQKIFVLENLMASEVEDWRKREKEFVEPTPSFIMEPWFKPTTFTALKTKPRFSPAPLVAKKVKISKKDKKAVKNKKKKRKS